jgi:predicted permease
MNNIILSIEVVFPLFAMISLGYFLKKIKFYDEHTLYQMSNLVFRVFLPIILFVSIYRTSLEDVLTPKLVGFAIVSVLAIYLVTFFLIPLFEKENAKRGVLIQGIFRSNYLLFGIPITISLFGESNIGVVSLLVGIIVPIFNILSVIALEVFRGKKIDIKSILNGVIKNPLIISSAIGIIFLFLKIKLPNMIEVTLSGLSKVATPLALVVLGGSFSFRNIKGNIKQILIGVLGKILIIPLIFIPLSIYLGFGKIELIALVVMFASPTAIASFTMAQQMDGDEALAGNLVVFSTAFSILTMFIIIFLLKQFSYI